MKRIKWLSGLIVITLSVSLLDACSFSIQVLTAPVAPKATPTSIQAIPFTPTVVPSTIILPSATPTLVPIRVDTIQMITIFRSFDLKEGMRSLAFTPDGTVLAAAGGNTEDFAIHLWDVTNGQAIGTLSGNSGIVWGVAFSPNGQMLASASSDKTAKIWDWRSGTLLKTLNFPDQVGSISFSPDGQTLAVGGLDDLPSLRAAIWTFSTGSWKPLLKIPEYVNITAMTYSPNGRWLVGGGASRNVQVWRTSDGTSVFTLNHAHQVLDVAVSPDNSTAATATCGSTLNDQCTEGSIWVWDLSTGKLIKKLANFPNVVESVAFSADGSALIAASRDGTLRVYATSNYESQFEADPPGGNGVMTLSPDGRLLATGGATGEVRLWKIVERP